MLAAAMQSWFRRAVPTPRAETLASAESSTVSGSAGPAGVPVPEASQRERAAERKPGGSWTRERLSVTDQLWGDGFTVPGGEVETLHLARPLGLSSASSLLLIGVGGGGPAGCIVRNLGAWVTGLEVEPALVQRAQFLMKTGQIGNKSRIEAWDPADPHFAPRRHHHCLAIEPLRYGGEPAVILDGMSETLKPGGQLVMTELVADAPLSADEPTAARWALLESRKLEALHSSRAITRMLARVGFDVRIVEDVSERHIRNAIIGWRVAIKDLEDNKPAPAIAARLVAEAEIWLLRVRLLRRKQLRMMRWHAIGRAAAWPAA